MRDDPNAYKVWYWGEWWISIKPPGAAEPTPYRYSWNTNMSDEYLDRNSFIKDALNMYCKKSFPILDMDIATFLRKTFGPAPP